MDPDPPDPSLRVLVVDDDVDAATRLACCLDILGCHTAVAFRGTAGLRIADQFEPHAAFIDPDLPDMYGCELPHALRGRAKAAVPVCICVSNRDSRRMRRLCMEAGFDAFLSKPLDNDGLQHALEHCRANASGLEA